MKKLLIATVAAISLAAGGAVAKDFDRSEFVIKASTETVDYKMYADSKDGLTGVGLGFTLFPYEVGGINANLYAELGYRRMTESFELDLEYQMHKYVGRMGWYGAVGVEYSVDAGNTAGSSLTFSPYVGAEYDFSDRAAGFAEVGYDWDMKNSWAGKGGYLEVGVGFSLSDNAYVRPSVVRTFNTGANSTQAKIEVGFAF
jgi:outer membrane protein W